jgi:hypothetical protein
VHSLRDPQPQDLARRRVPLNISEALRLLAAANDDAVLAAWAAVFYEHKMSPEADVSPYDCWEVLQGFLSNGVLSVAEYDSYNLKQAFFNGRRPSTRQIQEVLDRITTSKGESTMSQHKAMAPFAAFSNETTIERPSSSFRSMEARAPMEIGAFEQPRVQAPREMGAFQVNSQAPSLECRKVDASLYRAPGEFDVQLTCCGQQMFLNYLDESVDAADLEEDGMLLEAMFHASCPKCGKDFHLSASGRVPDNY